MRLSDTLDVDQGGILAADRQGRTGNKSRVAKGERGIWQRRYWEHLVRDERDYASYADYVHYNPVKHGYAERVADWPYSTFHRYVKACVYTEDWAGCRELNDDKHKFGE